MTSVDGERHNRSLPSQALTCHARHDHHPPRRPGRKRRRRAAVHQLLPPGRLHRPPGARLRARAEPGGEGRDRADPDQLAHVRRGPPADLPGHRHRQRVPEDRHGRALRGLHRQHSTTPSTKACAAATSTPTTRCARSIVADPQFDAQEHQGQHAGRDPHASWCPATPSTCTVAAKGGGSENKSKFVMLNPSDSVVDWVLKTVPTMGAGWCPPGMLGIGIGGTAEKAHADGQGSADGADRHVRAAGARPAQQDRGTAHRAVRQGQRAGHRRAGPGRPDHRARREDHDVPDARRQQAGGDDPELRRDAPRALRARRLRPGVPRAAEPGPLARRALGARLQEEQARQPRHADQGPRSRAGSRATRCCSTARC